MSNVEFAIQMEIDGQKYYLDQAEKNKGTALEKVFILLAKDEEKHEELVRIYAKAVDYQLSEENAITEFNNIFKSAEDFKAELKGTPEQIDAYRMALGKEKESIDLYQKMKEEAAEEKEKTLFDYLIKQEEYHYTIFDNLVQHLRHAEEWVEDAEFGKRETY
jgi:rubrerythrin